MVMQMLESKEREMSEVAFLVKEATELLSGDREIQLRKIHRSQNSVSHLLANKGRCEGLSVFWLDDECSCISRLVLDDLSPE
jgi:hypothetical protein